MLSLLTPSLSLALCFLSAAVNNSAPAVAASPPFLGDLLLETPKVGTFEVLPCKVSSLQDCCSPAAASLAAPFRAVL